MNPLFLANFIDDQSSMKLTTSKGANPMKTNEIDPFPQTLATAVTKLKNRLQRTYEQAYPELGDLVRIVLDEEEARAWELSFPHLLLPDLVEAHVAKLHLHLAPTKSDDFIQHDFAEIEPALASC
jgi:hypothetical protein